MKKLIIAVIVFAFFFGHRIYKRIGAGVDNLYQSVGVEKKPR